MSKRKKNIPKHKIEKVPSEKVKISKTNVAARALERQKQNLCKKCGEKIQIVKRVWPSGKRRFVRVCCEEKVAKRFALKYERDEK